MEKNRTVGLLIVIGAAMAIAGVFMSWVHFSFEFLGLNMSYDHTGIDIITGKSTVGSSSVTVDYDHAYMVTIAMALAAVAALLGLAGLFAGLPKGVAAYIGSITLIIGIAMAVIPYAFGYLDVFSQEFIVEKDGFTLGIGGWLSTAGGVIVAIGGIAGLAARK